MVARARVDRLLGLNPDTSSNVSPTLYRQLHNTFPWSRPTACVLKDCREHRTVKGGAQKLVTVKFNSVSLH